MNDFKLLFDYTLKNKIIFAATAAGMALGAFGGVMAFYHGWLG